MKSTRLFIIGLAAFLLVGCNAYKVDVDLTPGEKAVLEADIVKYEQEILDYEPTEHGSAIAWQAIIELARAYQELGELGKAIEVYEDVLEDGYATKAILNNLGKLYEKTEQYEKAVKVYQRISDEFFDHAYLYDMTWAYIKAGNRKEAEKYFNAWQLEFQKTDEQTQQAIKKLREAEKANET